MEKEAGKLEKAFLLEDKINTEALEKEAIPLPKPLNYKEFIGQFDNPNHAIIQTPIKELEINPRYAFYHLLKNHPLGNKKEARKVLSGGILDTLKYPLFVTQDSKGSIYFYKPFKNEKEIINLVSVEVNKNNKLLYKTSYVATQKRLLQMIKNYKLLYYAGGIPPL